VIGWLMSLWRAQQRRIDLEILWPTCKREAANVERYGGEWLADIDALEAAKVAFAVHAFNDPAWLCLGDEMIIATIDNLR
jgi:hypothetical protein